VSLNIGISKAADGSLIFGHPTPCQHCGHTAEGRENYTEQGTKLTAYFPSDTCCSEHAREVYASNRMWIARYRNLAQQTHGFPRDEYNREAKELEISNKEITAVMDARKKLAL
jgi:hypothetical protein